MPWSTQVRTTTNALTDDDVAAARSSIGRVLLEQWQEADLFATIVANARAALAQKPDGAYVVELHNDGPVIFTPAEWEAEAARLAHEASKAKAAYDEQIAEIAADPVAAAAKQAAREQGG